MKRRFKNYYEWCCLSFPEYREFWTEQMFDNKISIDGIKFDSYEELEIFNYLKSKFKNIEYIGNSHHKNSAHSFKTYYNGENTTFCPDMVIHTEGKLIYIEYYGMYEENHK